MLWEITMVGSYDIFLLCDKNSGCIIMFCMQVWYSGGFVSNEINLAEHCLQEDFNSWNYWKLPPSAIDIWKSTGFFWALNHLGPGYGWVQAV